MNFDSLRALVIDDSTTMVRIIANTLKRIGVDHVDTAHDGLEGFNKFKNNVFDVILTDWNMPIMNGLELIKKVRAENMDIPIIMITTEGGKSEVITALKAGCNQYIIKPFTPQILKEKLLDIMQHI